MNFKPQPVSEQHTSMTLHMRPPQRRRWPWIVAVAGALLVLAIGAAILWYFTSLRPVSGQTAKQVFTVKSGDGARAIAERLASQQLIRSSFAFELALRLSGKAEGIKAGSYRLSPSESADQIIAKLESGEVDMITLQISPGVTLDTVKAQFVAAGFRRDAVDKAFTAQYDHPLLKDRPAGANLEGYVFPDTYQFELDAGPDAALIHIFDTFYQRLNQDDLLTKAKARNLNTHQLITLASIIEKEVSRPDDQAHVAQVFLKRLSIDMPLGSDVTFIYAAKALGVPATPDLQSPYNTRIVKGLPPGPIANMRLGAIKAIISPTNTDDLYFLAGDDGVTYYAKTAEQHEANIAAHCKQNCQ